MIALTMIEDKWMLFIPAVGIGIGWASIMGNPYVILSASIPKERVGVYMGIFNMMIVIPMILLAITLPLYYDSWMQGDARNVLRMAGVMLFLASFSVLLVKVNNKSSEA